MKLFDTTLRDGGNVVGDGFNAELTVSAEDFRGGVRAVIRSRNILIDNSFKTQLRNEYDKFMFAGGDCNA